MFKKALFAVGVLLAFTVVSHAQTAVNVTVNAGSPSTRTAPVDERIFGVNSTMWDPDVSTQQTINLVQDAGIRFIRLPGGSNSDTLHWYTNQNVDSTTNLPTFKWVTGFDSSSKLIRSISPQAQAIVTVNYGSGSPEEAAAWVAYANFPTSGVSDVNIGTGTDPLNLHFNFRTASYWANLRATSTKLSTDDGQNFLRLGLTAPMGFKYWEIGNEVYGQTWEYDKHSPANEPFTYATNAANFITKMKQVDSTIKVGVVVEVGEDSYSNGTTHSVNGHRGWTPIVLDTLKHLNVRPDFLVYHRYEQTPLVFASSPSQAEDDAKLLQKAATWPNDAADLRNQITTYFGAGGENIELLITENNSVYSNPGKQTTSLVNALYMADSMANVMNTEFNSLAWWALRNGGDSSANNLSSSLYGWRNYGDYGILSTGDSHCTSDVITCNSTSYEKFPTYYAMKLMSFFARGGDTVISTHSDNNLLAVYGAKRSGDSSMSLLVINKDPLATANVQFTLSGFTPASSADIYTYGKPNDDAANPTSGISGCKDITSSTVSTGSTFSGSFAPYSISVITFGRSAFAITPATASVVEGSNVSLVGTTWDCATPAYQWQRNVGGNSSNWQPLSDGNGFSGTTTNTLTIAAATTMSGDQFRLIADNALTSNAATLTVSAASSSSSSSSASSSSSSSSTSSSSSSSSPPPSSGGGGGGGGSFNWELLLALLMLLCCTRTFTHRRTSY